jgi:hypothetical protein
MVDRIPLLRLGNRGTLLHHIPHLFTVRRLFSLSLRERAG